MGVEAPDNILAGDGVGWGGDAQARGQGVQGNPQVPSELEASLDYLKIISPKKKGRKKRNNTNGWWARSLRVVT